MLAHPYLSVDVLLYVIGIVLNLDSCLLLVYVFSNIVRSVTFSAQPSAPIQPAPTPNDASATRPSPIRPALKRPKGPKRPNAFYDDRGFPDPSDEYDSIIDSIDGGTVLRKRRHPAPRLDDIDPQFNNQYDPALHDTEFKELFRPSPILSAEQNDQLASLIKKYWPVFDKRGVFIPVRDYECVINTGSATPLWAA